MSKKDSIVFKKGDKINSWTIVEFVRHGKNQVRAWKCICKCGREVIVTQGDLKGNNKQCKKCAHKNCVKAVTKDLSGIKKGKLNVIDRAGTQKSSGQATWNCKCDCGNITIVRSSRIINYDCSDGCRKCNHYEKMKSNYWSHVKQSAKNRGYDLTITPEEAYKIYIQQQEKCFFTGISLYFADKTTKEQTASLDRIDSKKNYNIDNIQWVHKIINRMKWTLTNEEFYTLCYLIVENCKDKIKIDSNIIESIRKHTSRPEANKHTYDNR